MKTVSIKIRNQSPYSLPDYATTGSSGMDVRACIAEALPIEPLGRILVPTGLYVEIPDGFEIQIRSRSGLAIKQGITCLNSPGTIDADYRGEIKIILINLSDIVQTIQPGDRIAQMILQKIERVVWVEATALASTIREQGGFGHTGK